MSDGIGKIKLCNKFKNKLEGMLGGKLGGSKKASPSSSKQPKLYIKKKNTPFFVGDNESKFESEFKYESEMEYKKTTPPEKADKTILKKQSLSGGDKRIFNIQNIIKFPSKEIKKESSPIKYFLFGVSCTLNIVLLIQCFLI